MKVRCFPSTFSMTVLSCLEVDLGALTSRTCTDRSQSVGSSARRLATSQSWSQECHNSLQFANFVAKFVADSLIEFGNWANPPLILVSVSELVGTFDGGKKRKSNAISLQSDSTSFLLQLERRHLATEMDSRLLRP